MFMLFALNLLAFVAWMVNIWLQVDPFSITIAILFALFHGYMFTEYLGKWANERRRMK